ncbi:uncharacterized protein [Temnothorax longispinosus]|uniref:uncharacterized protein isoform X2 n=1 Tax=Temnothorax longispinosus TaxID=300112 RepID=UPI003A9A47A0
MGEVLPGASSLKEEEKEEVDSRASSCNIMSALCDPFPKASVADPQDERANARLMRFLETRIRKRDLLQEDLHEKQNHFRNILVELEHENAFLRRENSQQKEMISTLEGRVYKLQNNIDGLLYKLNDACDALRNLQQELRNKDRQLKEHILEKQKIIQRCNIKIQTERDRMTKEMEMKLKEQRERLTSYIKKKDDKMRLVRQILTSARKDTSDNVAPTSPIASSSRVEATEKTNVTIFQEEPSTVTSINLQASRSPRGQLRQTSCHARIISNGTNGKATEGPSSSLAKEKPSTVTFINSQIPGSHGQICQTSKDAVASRGKLSCSDRLKRRLSLCARTNSDDVQRKATKEPILMTESSMPSDSKTEISEEPNPTTPLDSPSSFTIASTDTTIETKTKMNTKIPVVNPRYQRVQSLGKWIDHRPTGIVPTGTILQPRTQSHNRTIRKLMNPKDFMARSSRYCLLSQEQDADGELETKLYKANVLPTCGGGAQIVFNDIECLKQISPPSAKKNVMVR